VQHLRKKLLKYLTRKLFGAVTAEDLFRRHNGVWYLGKKKLDSDHLLQLGEDAERLRKSLLWVILMKEVHYQAGKEIYEGKGDSGEAMVIARALFYAQKVYDEVLLKVERAAKEKVVG